MKFLITSGPATVVSPIAIDLLDLAPKQDDELYFHQLDNERNLYFHGDFSEFHSYMIVTHTKFQVIPESVRVISFNKFEATICFKNNDKLIKPQNIIFESPILPLKSAEACMYGAYYDSFDLSSFYGHSQKFNCDFTFLKSCSTNLLVDIPMKVEYIGIAVKNGRNAQDRLGKGHEKLQKVLAELVDRDKGKTASIILYRHIPDEHKHEDITFDEVIKIFEACLIQYFKPPLNDTLINFPETRNKLKSKLKSLKLKKIIISASSPDGASLYSSTKDDLTIHDFFVDV